MIEASSLRKYSLFGGMTEEDVSRLLPFMVLASFPLGEEVMKEGERNDRIFFILEGRVEVSKAGQVLIELGEGDTFGEMELLDVMPAAATVRALGPVKTASITNRAVHDIYHMDCKLFALMIMNLARDLSRRLRRMDELSCVHR
jgi:CRP/FNR family transcriptional regulator, cyclic AMP receptor protein